MSVVIVLADRLLATPHADPSYVGRMQEFFAASEILSNETNLVAAQAARESGDAATVLRWQAAVGLAVGVLGVLLARRQRSTNRALAAEASARREAEEARRESERQGALAAVTADVGPRRA